MKNFFLYSLIVFTALFLTRCASVQPPPGGPKDEKEPELISTIPVSGSKNYKGRTVQFIFDEAVELDNIYKQLLITPQTENLKYESRVKKNRVIIDFEEAFDDNTTYTINLRDAVVDITEKNIAKNVKVAFSTGNFIDSLSIEGTVADLFTGIPPENANVMLLRPEDTLSVQDPYYLSKIEKDGTYIIENIKEGEYQIFALAEEDNNYKYTKDEEEKIGFITDNIHLDTAITNLDFKVASYDNKALTFTRAVSRNQYVELTFSKPLKDIQLTFEDSLMQDSIIYGIENELVRLYNVNNLTEKEEEPNTKKEKNTVQVKKKKKKKKKDKNQTEVIAEEEIEVQDSIIAYITATDLLDNQIIDTAKFIFSTERFTQPKDLTLTVEPQKGTKKITEEVFDIELTFNKPITQFNQEGIHLLNKRDTLLTKINRQYDLVKSDTLRIPAELSYLKTNNLKPSDFKEWEDTLKLVVDKKYIIDNQALNDDFNLLLPHQNSNYARKAKKIENKSKDYYLFSIQTFDTTSVTLDTLSQQTVAIDTVPFTGNIISNSLNTLYTIPDYTFTETENIYIDSTAFISIEDDSVTNTTIAFQAKVIEDYGSLGGNIQIDTIPFFVQVLSDKYEMEQELYNKKSFRFDYVEPGTKYIRILIDNNKDGTWDKGSFLERIPPEEVYFRKAGGLDLRPNWEILDIRLTNDELSTYQQNKPDN